MLRPRFHLPMVTRTSFINKIQLKRGALKDIHTYIREGRHKSSLLWHSFVRQLLLLLTNQPCFIYRWLHCRMWLKPAKFLTTLTITIKWTFLLNKGDLLVDILYCRSSLDQNFVKIVAVRVYVKAPVIYNYESMQIRPIIDLFFLPIIV